MGNQDAAEALAVYRVAVFIDDEQVIGLRKISIVSYFVIFKFGLHSNAICQYSYDYINNTYNLSKQFQKKEQRQHQNKVDRPPIKRNVPNAVSTFRLQKIQIEMPVELLSNS